MTDNMDSLQSRTTRREKPQTLDGIQATKSLNDTNCSPDSSINSTDSRLIRNRPRSRNSVVSETRSPRDHSSDGVMSTGAEGGVDFANEFHSIDDGPRRESLNYDDTSPSSQNSFAKSIVGRSLRLPCSGGTTTRKCVLTLDGYSYVIVASTPENLPKRDDSSCSSGGGSSNINNTGSGGTGCSFQSGIVSNPLSDCNSSTQTATGVGSGSGGVGGNNTLEFSNPSCADGTSESTNISITSNNIVSSLNGQVARHGALTIVRRSNSRKNFTQLETQHLLQHQQQVSSPTPSSTRGSILSEDCLGKASSAASSAVQQDNRLNESSANITQQSFSSAQTPPIHNVQQQQPTPPPLKMLPTSPNASNNAPLLPTATDTQDDNMSESIMSMDDSASTLASAKANVDLATENLPAVDTPDACDKAALRLRSLLRMLNSGEISAEVLQKNLHYAARVLEAVFIDESKSPTSGKSKLRQNSCSSVECEEDETKNDKCNGDCKNVECQQHHHQRHHTHTTCERADDEARSNDNNNTDQSLCSLNRSEEASKTAPSEDAPNNQISIDSRTKGVCSAPQTHSGPTGPPGADQSHEPHAATASDNTGGDQNDKNSEATPTTCSSTLTATTSGSANNSTVSSSSCSNKATIQRQKRLRTPVWARSMSTNKTCSSASSSSTLQFASATVNVSLVNRRNRSRQHVSVQHHHRHSNNNGDRHHHSYNNNCPLGRLADEDDELSEVQPDAVPPEVREWLASTFTRQLATTRKKTDEKPKFRSVAHAIRAGIFVDRIYRRVSSTALMTFPAEVVKVLKTLDDWCFDVFALAEAANGQPVKFIGYDLLNRYGIIHKFKIAPATLETFLNRIEEGYCRYRNPYHNNLHAADVTQTVHHMLCQTGLMNWLTDLEIFATLLAALIHDYEHTGTTNNFHVMSGSETALLYNDRAVLENHHISAAFRLLKDDDCNVLSNLSREEYRELRTLIIDMVLSTDMSFHFQQLKNMKNLLTLNEATVDKSKALALVLHCCDISHPAKRWNLHHRWTMLLLEEFFRQGDLERELGLPFSPLCDRNNTLVAESQIGFIDFIVDPSMSVMADMLEHALAPIAPMCKNVNASIDAGDVPVDSPVPPGSGSRHSLKGRPTCEAITEDNENKASEGNNATSPAVPQSGSAGGSSSTAATAFKQKFTIRKPWVACLTDNKKIWKEQAIKDAEARAAASALEDADKPSEN